MVISWFETNFPIISARFRCIGGGGAVVTGVLSAYTMPGRWGLVAAEFTLVAAEVTLVAAEVTLVAAEVTLTATGRRSVLGHGQTMVAESVIFALYIIIR